jgi:hypothetical protein
MTLANMYEQGDSGVAKPMPGFETIRGSVVIALALHDEGDTYGHREARLPGRMAVGHAIGTGKRQQL